MRSLEEMPHVLGADGEFHAEDEAADLSGTPPEAWVALAFFWTLGAVVLYQFGTRYLLNDSAAWTEEIARYLLIATVFTGATIGVAKNNHIQVDLLYRWLPAKAARVLSVGVDLVRAAFFIAMVVLTVQLMLKMESYQMTIIDLPMNIVYGVCLFGLAMAALRSLWVMKVHWQRGYSVLERPETTMEDR